MKLNFAVNMNSLINHVCCDLIFLYRDLRSYLGGRTLSDLCDTDPLPQSTTDQGVQVWPQGLDNVPTIVYIFILYTQLFYFSLGNVLDSEKSHNLEGLCILSLLSLFFMAIDNNSLYKQEVISQN